MRTLIVRIWRSRWLPVAAAVICASLIPMGLASAESTSRQGRHARISGAEEIAPHGSRPGPRAPRSPSQGPRRRRASTTRPSGTSCSPASAATWSGFASRTRSALPRCRSGASIAVAATGAATAGPTVPLTFGGLPSIQIPDGAEVLSDPVRLYVPKLHDLDVSVYLPQATGPATQHALGQQVNYIASGDQTADSSGSAYTGQTQSWFFIDSVDVSSRDDQLGTLVAFGDSITDGFNSTVGTNARWPNDLARRLDSRHDTLAVADEGISGDRVLTSDLCCGVNALTRLDRDVLDRAGATEVILIMGINDIGFSVTPPNPVTNPLPDVSAAQIVAGYEQIIAQAHAAGLKIFGATLTPFKGAGYYSPPARRSAKRSTTGSGPAERSTA